MEFTNVGKRCQDKTCRLQDFLPFNCKYCSQNYCNEHFKEHRCEQSQLGAKKAIVCPVCNQTIYYKQGEDENAKFHAHSLSKNCNPENYEKIENKKLNVCPALNCKTKLSKINSVNCKSCGYDTCLAHRFENKHQCQPVQKTGFMKYYYDKFFSNSQNNNNNNNNSNNNNNNDNINRNIQKQNIQQNLIQEQCEKCGQQFKTEEQLINHVIMIHIS